METDTQSDAYGINPPDHNSITPDYLGVSQSFLLGNVATYAADDNTGMDQSSEEDEEGVSACGSRRVLDNCHQFQRGTFAHTPVASTNVFAGTLASRAVHLGPHLSWPIATQAEQRVDFADDPRFYL